MPPVGFEPTVSAGARPLGPTGIKITYPYFNSDYIFHLEKSMNTIDSSPVDVAEVLKYEVSKNKAKNFVTKMQLA
jgi:hypothetical protein